MGFGAASVRDIVRRTDLASGTFYNYFKDKDEIFEAVVGELTGELLKRHNNGRAKATTAEAFFHGHYAVYFEFIVEDAELLALARKNFTAIRTLLDKPDVRALALALNDDIRAAIAAGRAAQRRRELPRRCDGRHCLRDLDRHGGARPGRSRRRRRIRHPPDDGRSGPRAEAMTCHPEAAGRGTFRRQQRSLATLGMTAGPKPPARSDCAARRSSRSRPRRRRPASARAAACAPSPRPRACR